MHELKTIKWKSSKIAEQRKQLHVDRVDLKRKNEELKKAVATLEDKIGDMHS